MLGIPVERASFQNYTSDLFCLVVVAAVVSLNYADPYSRRHGYTWKYALQFAEKNASVDGATVVMCSDFPQSDYLPMPVGDEVKKSAMFTPLSYYKLKVPVVGLPRGLNDEAMRDGRTFLQSADHRRFLVLGFRPSRPVLQWLRDNAAATHDVRELGKFDNSWFWSSGLAAKSLTTQWQNALFRVYRSYERDSMRTAQTGIFALGNFFSRLPGIRCCGRAQRPRPGDRYLVVP